MSEIFHFLKMFDFTAPSKKDVAYKMTGSYHTKWAVEFLPKELGMSKLRNDEILIKVISFR